MAPLMIGKGADIRGIGRWAWKILQDKAQLVTVLSVYRPCKPFSSGVQTVYEQHTRALIILSDSRTQFLIYLKQCIQNRQAQGDLIILGMDLNDLVQQYDHTQFFDKLHMKEAILTIYSGSTPSSKTIRNASNILLMEYGVAWD